jgi:hypothetical protein
VKKLKQQQQQQQQQNDGTVKNTKYNKIFNEKEPRCAIGT